MFRPIRRIKKEIPAEQAKQLLILNKRAALSVNGDMGYPFTVPVNFYYDEKENVIFIHCARAGHKADSINRDDKVCFTTWDDGVKEDDDWAYYVSSCVVFGRASFVADPAVKLEKLRLIGCKYYPNAEEVEDIIRSSADNAAIVRIDIEHISGKRIHEK